MQGSTTSPRRRFVRRALLLASSTTLAAATMTGLAVLGTSPAGATPILPAGTNVVGNCVAAPAPGTNFGAYPGSITGEISLAVAATPSGGTVYICPGTWVDNVTVATPMTIEGAGQGTTTVIPEYSNPTGYGDVSSNDFDSTVFLVQADDVTIQALTINGSNPSAVTSPAPWTSSTTCDTTFAYYGEDGGCAGVNFNAGAGIDTGCCGATVVTGMTVQDVTVENVLQLGIGNRTYDGSYNFSNDTVTDVGGDYIAPYLYSQGIFSYESNGTIANDTVSWTQVAIQTNWGAQTVTGNTVEDSNWGIQLDNVGEPAGYAGGASSTIADNSVSSCWGQDFFGGAAPGDSELGISLFASFAPTAEYVSNNTVSGCSTGLADFSSNNDCPTVNLPSCPAAYGTPVAYFSDNTVDGDGLSNGIGVLVSTDKLGYNDGPVDAQLTGNTISGFPTALYTDETYLDNWAQCPPPPGYGPSQGGFCQTGPDAALPGGLSVTASGNQFDGSWFNDATGSISASGNWWGSAGGPSVTIGAPDGETSAALIGRAAPTWRTTRNGLPSAPQALSLSRGSRRVTASWSAPAFTGSSDPSVTISHYTVTAEPGGGTCSTASFSCTITGLSNGTSYTFFVTATSSAGTGPAASASTTPGTKPGTPTGASATAADGVATVSWLAAPSGGLPVSYTVTASPGGATCATFELSCVVTGLTDGTPYHFSIVATNASGSGPPASAGPVIPATTGFNAYTVPVVAGAGRKFTVSVTGAADNSHVRFMIAHNGSHGATSKTGTASTKFAVKKPGLYTVTAFNRRAKTTTSVYIAKVTVPALSAGQIPVTTVSAMPGSTLTVATNTEGTYTVPVPDSGKVTVDLPLPTVPTSLQIVVSDDGSVIATRTVSIS